MPRVGEGYLFSEDPDPFLFLFQKGLEQKRNESGSSGNEICFSPSVGAVGCAGLLSSTRRRELDSQADQLLSPFVSRASSPVLSPQQAPYLPPGGRDWPGPETDRQDEQQGAPPTSRQNSATPWFFEPCPSNGLVGCFRRIGPLGVSGCSFWSSACFQQYDGSYFCPEGKVLHDFSIYCLSP